MSVKISVPNVVPICAVWTVRFRIRSIGRRKILGAMVHPQRTPLSVVNHSDNRQSMHTALTVSMYSSFIKSTIFCGRPIDSSRVQSAARQMPPSGQCMQYTKADGIRLEFE